METYFLLFKIAFSLIVSWLISKSLACILTRYTRPLINYRPFNCQECLSFWLTLIFGLLIAYDVRGDFDRPNIATLVIVGYAFLLGVINFLTVKSKIKIYE